ncbi:hypothetical protein Q3309_18770 [Clostridioides difficile]
MSRKICLRMLKEGSLRPCAGTAAELHAKAELENCLKDCGDCEDLVNSIVKSLESKCRAEGGYFKKKVSCTDMYGNVLVTRRVHVK